MSFSPTYNRIEENEPWTNEYYNQLITDIQSAFGSLNGSDLASPLELTKSSQNLYGNYHTISGFKRWFGDGTVGNSVQDVTGYGAVGNGSTDDASAIQDAIDALPTTGGAIFFPPGTYIINTPIYMTGTNRTTQCVYLFGTGRSSIIKLGSSFPTNSTAIVMGGKQLPSESMKISDMALDGNDTAFGAGSNQAGIDMAKTKYAIVKNVYIHDFEGNGVLVAGSILGKLNCLYVTECIEDGISQGDPFVAENLMISACTLNNNGANGINLGPVNGLLINRCHSSNHSTSQMYGIKIKTEEGASCRRVLIKDCICEGNGRGILIGAITNKGSIEQASVVGCEVRGNTGYGIYVITIDESGTSSGRIRTLLISGNQSNGNGADGCCLYGDVKHGSISSNSFCDNGTAQNSAGLRIRGGDDPGTEGVASYISVTGNVCGDGQSSPCQYEGIVLEASTQYITYTGNVTGNNTNAQIRDEGTNNSSGHNPGA